MKWMHLLIPVCLLSACASPTPDSNPALQARIDSLEKKLANAYKPGFGEFMSSIQAHHLKLWLAGRHANWPLADFEIDEIKENFDAIRDYEKERKETALLPMIYPALDSVTAAIKAQDTTRFRNQFSQLTQTCNSCHQSAGFGFNAVKTPAGDAFPNQDFSAAH